MEGVLGGTLRHLDYLLRFADGREFDIHLALSAERGLHVREAFRRWSSAGWPVHEIPMSRAINPPSDLRAFLAILRLCARERFDVVHAHCAKAGFLGRLAGRMTGARTIYTPHVFPFPFANGGTGRVLYRALERMAARWTDTFVLLSNYQLNVLIHARLADPGRTVIVPNGVVAEEFSGPDRKEARRALDLKEAGPVVLFAGRFRPHKGLHILLEAARLLKERVPGLQVVIVGEGPLHGWLADQIASPQLSDVVKLHGQAEHMRLYYAACDLVVMPSQAEGMPYVLLEAKAAARPMIATLISGMEEFIEHGRDGFLVPPENPEALAATLREALSSPSRLAESGLRARQSLRAEWHAERSVEETLRLYRKLAALRS